jgi:hypothetical protein
MAGSRIAAFGSAGSEIGTATKRQELSKPSGQLLHLSFGRPPLSRYGAPQNQKRGDFTSYGGV